MRYKIFDFECQECDSIFEEMIEEGEIPQCPKCFSSDVERLMPTTRANTMNLLSPQEYKSKMLKRSSDHTKAMLAKDGYKGKAVVNLKK